MPFLFFLFCVKINKEQEGRLRESCVLLWSHGKYGHLQRVDFCVADCERIKTMGKNNKIIIGNTYDNIRVLSICENEKYRKYKCRCLRCGNIFESNGHGVFLYKQVGCLECRKNDRNQIRIKEAQKYVGRTFNELTIKKIIGIREYTNRKSVFVECECSCGKKVEMPIQPVIHGQRKTCGHDRNKNLNVAHEVFSSAAVDGTVIFAIDGRRKVNKNNKTGITGVSWMKQLEKYRAYIFFQGKQYNLGCFKNIDDAIEARKEAEDEIYGGFLDWYAENYPEQWKKLQKKNK